MTKAYDRAWRGLGAAGVAARAVCDDSRRGFAAFRRRIQGGTVTAASTFLIATKFNPMDLDAGT